MSGEAPHDRPGKPPQAAGGRAKSRRKPPQTAGGRAKSRRKPPQAAGGRPSSPDAQGGLLIDVRGPRFSATITAILTALALVVQGEFGVALVVFQTLVFAVAAFAGLRWSPYGNLFRFLKRRLNWGPPPAVEPEGPPRFSQLVGFLMSTGALLCFAAGARLLGWILVGFVFAAAVLLALTGL